MRSLAKIAQSVVNFGLRPLGIEVRRIAPPPRPLPRPTAPAMVAEVQEEIARLCPNPNYAANYRNFEYGLWSQWLPLLLYIDRASGPRKVLDIGCGYGTLLAVLSRLGWEVHGTDILPQSVMIGERTIERFGIVFRPSNIEREELPYSDGTFDHAFLIEVIEHFHFQPVTALKRALRVIKPGGYLLLSTPALEYGWSRERYDMPFEEIPEWSEDEEIDPVMHKKIYSPAEFERLLSSVATDVFSGIHVNESSRRGFCYGCVRKEPSP